jgi:hypothetical protein
MNGTHTLGTGRYRCEEIPCEDFRRMVGNSEALHPADLDFIVPGAAAKKIDAFLSQEDFELKLAQGSTLPEVGPRLTAADVARQRVV